jgi:hypothetical protein
MTEVVCGEGQKVSVSHGADEILGRVVQGEAVIIGDDGMIVFDLDAPFIVLDEDGEKYQVREPWNCHIESI